MKTKHLFILLFALGIALPMKAQSLYGAIGFSSQSTAIRLGYTETIGGEIYIKSDNNRLFKGIPDMDGRRHRFSLMGGVNYNFADLMLFTVNAGYGSTATYRVAASGDQYGVENLARGFEAGLVVDFFIGNLTIFGGWSRIFASAGPMAGTDEAPKLTEFTFGIGYML